MGGSGVHVLGEPVAFPAKRSRVVGILSGPCHSTAAADDQKNEDLQKRFERDYTKPRSRCG